MARRIAAFISLMLAFAACQAQAAQAEQAAPLSALARMPVKEITVFKDGHAFVLHEGKMPVDAAGNVVMDYLPTPVLGTFWPYSGDVKAAKLTAVVAGQRRVLVDRSAMTLKELIEANVGATGTFTEVIASGNTINVNTYMGVIVGILARSSEELEKTSPPGTGPMLPQKSNIVLIRTEKEGAKAVNMDNIRDVAFKSDPKLPLTQEELRGVLTLKLDWAKNPAKEAEVGMMYLQRGLRWIPNYKLSIDGQGGATVKLEATLINELTDLTDVTANLVIGVPTFDFKDTVDPIAIQGMMAQLSQYFATDSRSRFGLSNAIESQTSRMTQRADQGGAPGAAEVRPPADLGPEIAGSQKNEDQYVFTVNHVTLKKGQRMTLPVTEFSLKYKDVYKLTIPITPPREVLKSFDSNRQAEVARLMNAAKPNHVLRLANDSKYPLTTAPVLIMRGDKVLSQGMMTYTGIGGTMELPVTTAVDIQAKQSDKETKRTPNAETWEKRTYNRVDLAGTIKLTNLRGSPVDIEVTRFVAGTADEADRDGKAEMIYGAEGAEALPAGGPEYPYYYPTWWGWYSWPAWWHHFNGIGRFSWTVKLEANKSVDLGYQWHYLWQ